MIASRLEGTPKLVYEQFHETIGARDVDRLDEIIRRRRHPR